MVSGPDIPRQKGHPLGHARRRAPAHPGIPRRRTALHQCRLRRRRTQPVHLPVELADTSVGPGRRDPARGLRGIPRAATGAARRSAYDTFVGHSRTGARTAPRAHAESRRQVITFDHVSVH